MLDLDIEALRKRIHNDTTTIVVSDLGAGSRLTQGSQRSIASIARHSAKPLPWVQFLTRLVKHYSYHRVLDLGTSLGLTTAYLARQAHVTTVEGCPAIAEKAREHFQELQITVDQHIGNLDTWLPQYLPVLGPFDLVILDANHQFEPTIRYTDLILAHLPAHGCVILDDIHWSKGMGNAWNILCQDPRVSVSIDLFGMGVLFIRPEQEKQHFILR